MMTGAAARRRSSSVRGWRAGAGGFLLGVPLGSVASVAVAVVRSIGSCFFFLSVVSRRDG